MSLKREIQQIVLRGIARLPLVPEILANSSIRRVLGKTPVLRALYPSGGDRPHPFDLAHGINAGGYVGIEELGSCVAGVAASQPFVASQPGILRAALATLPSLETCTFVDLGCGKGRPLFVAAEFPFHDIVGIELSPSLAKIARKNAGVAARSFPSRTRVRIEEGDVATFHLPPGNLVLFLYHPFSQDVIKTVAAKLDAALAAERRIVYVVYYNPVFGACFDESRILARRLARMIPCAPEELGFGMDIEEAVVVWQSCSAPSPPEHADARIVITKPGRHAVLEP